MHGKGDGESLTTSMRLLGKEGRQDQHLPQILRVFSL